MFCGMSCPFTNVFIIILVTNFPTHVNCTHPNPIPMKYELNTLIQMEDISKKVIFAILLLSCPARTFMSVFIYDEVLGFGGIGGGRREKNNPISF